MPIRLLTLLALLSLSLPVAAEIYKYVENGVVTYGERKPRSGDYQELRHDCLFTYIGCTMSNADWDNVPLNTRAFRSQIETSARRYGVDEALIRAVVHAESAFNQRAVSRAGAQGLMQLMPTTQDILGVSNPFDAQQNIDAGTRLMRKLLKKYNYNIKLACAAYNAGEGAVRRYNGVPPYKETRNYIRRVSQLYERYQRYYQLSSR